MNFLVLNGGKNNLENKKDFLINKYYLLYNKYLYGFDCDIDICKAIFYGVKYVVKERINNLNYKELLKLYCTMDDIIALISKITYNQFINIFPIDKDYNGYKYEAKDYFSTQDYLSDKNMSEIIQLENVGDLIFSFFNKDIMNFGVRQLLILDRIRRAHNQVGVLEEFLSIIDPENQIDTYTMDTNKNILINNNNGKVIKLRKSIPRHLKIIK